MRKNRQNNAAWGAITVVDPGVPLVVGSIIRHNEDGGLGIVC